MPAPVKDGPSPCAHKHRIAELSLCKGRMSSVLINPGCLPWEGTPAFAFWGEVLTSGMTRECWTPIKAIRKTKTAENAFSQVFNPTGDQPRPASFPEQKLMFRWMKPCFLRPDTLGNSNKCYRNLLLSLTAGWMWSSKCHLGWGLFLKEWCKQIAGFLQHTAENVCSFVKKAYPETECQDEWEFLSPFIFNCSEAVLIHANINTHCSLILAASMLACLKSNPVKASRTALEVRPV